MSRHSAQPDCKMSRTQSVILRGVCAGNGYVTLAGRYRRVAAVAAGGHGPQGNAVADEGKGAGSAVAMTVLLQPPEIP
jgi:hypothetical protein